MKIDIYSKSNCPYCVRAKAYLKQHGIAYQEHVLDDATERQRFYQRIGENVTTVPQIFLTDGHGTHRIGGYSHLIASDVVARHQAGNFDEDF